MGRFIFSFLRIAIGLAIGLGIFRAGPVVSAQELNAPVRVFLPAIMSLAGGPAQAGDPFEGFLAEVITGESQVLTGVYVEGRLAYRVQQQPAGDYGYIAPQADIVTQFMLTLPQVTGLLAHNNLAGKDFDRLTTGDEVLLVEGDGLVRRYRVAGADEYQALQPFSATSDLLHLESGETLTTAEVFARYYMGEEHVTFQTCIERGGNSSWGRLFVVALPVEEDF